MENNNAFAIGAAVIFAVVLVVVGAYALSNRAPVVASIPGYSYPGYTVAPASYLSGPPYYMQRSVSPIVVAPPVVVTSTQPAFCTMDAKMCPDGSYVGRVPPACQFAACPL